MIQGNPYGKNKKAMELFRNSIDFFRNMRNHVKSL